MGSSEYGLRRVVAFTPEEEEANRSYETSPAVRNELSYAIRSERDPNKRAVLEQSYQQDFGEPSGVGGDDPGYSGALRSAFSAMGVPQDSIPPSASMRPRQSDSEGMLKAAFAAMEDKPVKQKRGIGDIAADTAMGFAKGAGSLVKGVGWLAGSDALTQAGSTAEDYWGAKQSAELQRQLAEVGKAEGVFETIGALWKNPAAIGDYIATSVPQMIPGMGVGSVGARGIVALAGNSARNAALKAGATEAAAMQAGRVAAEKAAEKSAMYFATGANMVGEGAISGGSTGAEVEQFMLDHGATPDQAKSEANKAAMMAGAWTTAGAGIGAGMETKAMLGQLKDAGIKGFAKNVGKEALEEAIQNPGEDYAAYQAKVQLDPTQTFDPGKSATLGAVTGGIMGAGFHAAGRVGERMTDKPVNDGADPYQSKPDQEPVVPPETPQITQPSALSAVGEHIPYAPASERTPYSQFNQENYGYSLPAAGAEFAVPATSRTVEGEVLGPLELPPGQKLLPQPPIDGESQRAYDLPRQMLENSEPPQPSVRQLATARGLLNHNPSATPESIARLMRVDDGMAQQLYQMWQQSQGAKNGAEPSNGRNAEVAAQGAQGGRGILPGSADVLASASAGDTGRASESAKVASPSMRPAVSAGVSGAEGVAAANQPKALNENAAKRQAVQLTNQGYPTVAFHHPTQAGMWAIGSPEDAKAQAKPAAETPLDIQAHAAATSPFNAIPQPSEAQKEAGNYRKGHLTLEGLNIAIENPAGSVRSGTDASGNAWETKMQDHYGYIKGTIGKDKDHIDVFIKPGSESSKTAYVVDQTDPNTGRFDEHKVILGADSEQEARDTYQANYSHGWNGLGAITPLPMSAFKAWLNNGNTRKPLSYVEPEKQLKPAQARQRITPMQDDRLEELSGYRHRLEQMADEFGWAEKGGRLLRDTDGNVSGRTPWIPHSDLWPGRPGNVSEKDARKYVQDVLDGKPLPAAGKRFISYLLDYQDMERAQQSDNESELSESAQEVYDAALAEARNISDDDLESMLESMAIKHGDAADGFYAEATKYLKGVTNAVQQRNAGQAGQAAAGSTREGQDAGGAAARARPHEEANRPDFQLQSHTREEVASKEVRAADEAVASKDRADLERNHFSLDGGTLPSESSGGTQAGLFTPDGRATQAVEAKTIAGKPVSEMSNDSLERIADGKSASDEAKGKAKEELNRRDAQSNPRTHGVNYADDFAIRPVEIIGHLISTGNINALYKAAGVKTADAFSALPMAQRSKAYAQYVEDGGQPAPPATEAYNDKVARMEREALVRRLQSDATVLQANGKPFKTEVSAKGFSARNELGDTHEVSKVDSGYVLKRLPEARRPSVIKSIEDRQANDPENQRQERAFSRAAKIGAAANEAVTAYENGETSIEQFEAALDAVESANDKDHFTLERLNQSIAGKPVSEISDKTLEQIAKSSQPSAGKAKAEVARRQQEQNAVDKRIADAEASGIVLSESDKAAIRESLQKAETLNAKANSISIDPMNKGNAFPMGVGFTKITKRTEQRIDASVRRAGDAADLYKKAEVAEKHADALLSGKGTDADIAKKAEQRTEMQRNLIERLLNWKKGDKIGKFTVDRVSFDKDGYPSSYTISGDGIVKGVMDKTDVAREFFGGNKDTLRKLVDEMRVDQADSKHGEGRVEADGAPKTYTIAEHSETIDKLNSGTLTIDAYKDAFARARHGIDALKAEFSAMTKDQIMKTAGLSYQYKNDTKERIVRAAADGVLDDFDPREMKTWTMGTDRHGYISKVTQEDLTAYAERRKARIAEYAAEHKAAAEGAKNPQTIDDFRAFIGLRQREGMNFSEARMQLTPEQRARFDELMAESSRKARNYSADRDSSVRVAAKTTEGQIVETKHTKTGEDLFVVKAAERVERDVFNQWNATAKKLGGWYSSYSSGGAVPGFQFKTRENAAAFLKYLGGNVDEAQSAVQERRDAFADDKSQSAVERLREMAGRLDESADESLGRERKANTARRARFAASADASANADKALAKTMRNIATAIGDGSAKFLDRVRQKVQVEMLAGFLRTAKDAELRSKYQSYGDLEKHKGEPATAETADHAAFPYYTAYRSDLASLSRQLLQIEGTKKLGQRLAKVADDVTTAYTKFAKENLHKMGVFSLTDGRPAHFSNKESAEAAISRSGFNGRAVVLQVKRGENVIIPSPDLARERGLWTGDDDKRITLSDEFGAELVEAIGRRANRMNQLSVPWQFQTAYDKRKRLSAIGIETPAEFRSALREFIGLQAAPKEADKIKQMERAMVGRKNDGLDFFPTPEAVSQEMIDAAEIKDGMSVLEPSAGMGHIAEQIRESGVDPDVVEMDANRRELLEAKGFNLVGRDFMEVSGEYDRIIMNPPFSNRRDAEHVQHAYALLKPGGRIVAIMGEGVFFGQDKKATEFREWLESVGGTSEKLEDGTFLDPSLPVNTGVNARMVVIDRKETDSGVAMFNAKSGSRGNPIDAAALESTIDRVISGSPSHFSRDTVVTASLFADLPAPVLAKAKKEGYDSNGRKPNGEKLTGATYDGKVYLVQENISSELEAEETLLHERIHQIVHGNAKDPDGIALRQSLGKLYIRAGAKSGIERMAKEAGIDMTGPLAAFEKVAAVNRHAFLAEEFLAHAEGQRAYEKLPAKIRRAAREFWGEFRDWLRSSKFVRIAEALGAKLDDFTQSDLAWTLKGIRQQEAGTGSKAIRFMTAWHGSPHDHDGFDSSKIGTGEGAQAYGYGLYFAGARDVAEWYRNTLSKPKTKATIDGKDFEDIDWLRNSGIEERWFNNWVAHPIASGIEDDMMVGDRINRLAERADQDGNTTKAKAVRKLLKMFNDGKIEAKIEKGRLYQVELAPEQDEYLDWDKPLSEQSEKVKAAIQDVEKQRLIGIIEQRKQRREQRTEEGGDTTALDRQIEVLQEEIDAGTLDIGGDGNNYYKSLWQKLGGDREASKYLHSLGIRGIKYLDGSSRGAGEGSHNYVIFDDADVKITGKESRRVSFAHNALQELATEDALFRYPVSKSASVDGVMHEVFPGVEYYGEHTLPDERTETGADHRYVFQTPDTPAKDGKPEVKGKQFEVFTTDAGRVWVDVHRLQPGDQGSRVYAAVANYAHNARKVFGGDPVGVSPAAIIARTKMMLASALRFGTTRHIDAAYEQEMGMPDDGIPPLEWRGNDIDKTRALIQNYLATVHSKAPAIRNYSYDFDAKRFVNNATGLEFHPSGPAFDAALGEDQRRAARIGEDSGRAAILIQSLVSEEGGGIGNGGILQAILNNSRSLIEDGGLKGLFSMTTPANAGVSVSAPSESVRRIQSVVNRFKAQFKGASALDIRVVSTTQDIPPRFRPSPFAEGVFHDDAGLIYLVTANLRDQYGQLNDGRAWQVLLHEAVGHFGLSQMMGDRFNGILKQVMQAAHAKGRVETDIYKPGHEDYATVEAVRLRYPDASDAEVSQEVLARMAETEPGRTLFGYARAAVRQWLRDMARAIGFKVETTTAELNDLVAKASAYMRNGAGLGAEYGSSGLVAASNRGQESRAHIVGDSGRYTEAQRKTFSNVGREVIAPTVKERITEWSKDLGMRLRQGIADQFAPLKNLDEKAYMLSRMSKGADGALEALLKYGRVFIKDGVYDVDAKDGGVIDKLLRPLGKEADDFVWWVAGNRADELAKTGRENLMTPDDINALKSLADGKLDFDYPLQNGKTTRDRAEAYKAANEILQQFNKSVMDIAEESGLIDGDARAMWERDFYVPFYREMEGDKPKFPNVKSGLVRQKAFERLKGGSEKLNSDLLANTLLNWSHLLNASAKNRAAKASLEAAERVGVAERLDSSEKDSVSYRDNGNEVHFKVNDPFILNAITALEFSGFSGPAMQAMGAFKRWLTMGVTANPAFKIRNLIRDSISAIGTAELSYNGWKNLKHGYAGTSKNSQTYASMLASGGVIRFGSMIEGNRAGHVRKLTEKGIDPNTIIDDESKLKMVWNRYAMPMIERYNELGDRSENINRAALYEQLRAKGVSHAEASLQARDLLDFSMGGTWAAVRFLTQVVPFANARIQGLYKLGRAANEDPRRMGYVVGAVALASLALLAAYSDDDDWKKREDWDRDTYWWFKIGDTAFRIPKPFEIGAIGTLAERSAELLFDKEMDGERFGKRIGKMVGDTFAMNPMPQMFKPMYDLATNTDSFTGRPIESLGMEKLRPEDRFTSRSSEVAKAIGKAGVLSPVQIDHVIRGYFGWLGTAAVTSVDQIVRLGDENQRPDMKLRDTFLIGNFVESLPAGSSRYVTQMYEQSKAVEEAYASFEHYLKSGDKEKAEQIYADEKDKIGKRLLMEHGKQSLTALNKQAKAIEENRQMTGEAKRAGLDRIEGQKNAIAKQILTAGL